MKTTALFVSSTKHAKRKQTKKEYRSCILLGLRYTSHGVIYLAHPTDATNVTHTVV
jgi:hypothetical protein